MSRQVNVRPHIVCPFCQASTPITTEDLGFEEFECSSCENWIQVPETMDEIAAFNLESMKAIHEASKPTHYRVMLQGEDGMLSCLKNNVPEEYADLVCEGLQTHYTEGQRVFLEPEETMADIQRMCREINEY